MPTTHVLAVVHVKGGVGKTTTTAHVAHALHERGLRVEVIDADPQESLCTWHDASPFPFRCRPFPSKRLDRELPGWWPDGRRPDVVVIDTPGTEHGVPIIAAAVRAATHVLIPCAPTPAEYERLRAVRRILDDARPDDLGPAVGVLQVKVRAGASSTAVYRAAMTRDGWRVLAGHVGMLERFAQALGEPVRGALRSGYGDAAAELLGLERIPHHAAVTA